MHDGASTRHVTGTRGAVSSVSQGGPQGPPLSDHPFSSIQSTLRRPEEVYASPAKLP